MCTKHNLNTYNASVDWDVKCCPCGVSDICFHPISLISCPPTTWDQTSAAIPHPFEHQRSASIYVRPHGLPLQSLKNLSCYINGKWTAVYPPTLTHSSCPPMPSFHPDVYPLPTNQPESKKKIRTKHVLIFRRRRISCVRFLSGRFNVEIDFHRWRLKNNFNFKVNLLLPEISKVSS